MGGTIYTLILLVMFVGIVIWVLGNKKRRANLDKDAEIPFDGKGN